MMMKTLCGLCLDPVQDKDGSWVHVYGYSTEADPHDPLVDCPRCGADLNDGRGLVGHSLPEEPYHIFNVAFWRCWRCRGVFHRWGTDVIAGVRRRWGRDDERRSKVEDYFTSRGGEPDGEGVPIT